MRLGQYTAAIGALATAAVATPTRQRSQGYDKPLVESEGLQAQVTVEDLKKYSQALEDIAYATPERNRVFGSTGHNETVKLLEKELKALGDYYDISFQNFEALYSEGNATFSADGVDQQAVIFAYSANGDVEAPLVAVSNLGCNATDYPSEVSGKIALISRGSCEFGLKSSRAGAAGAVGAVIYNNVPGPIGGGTLGEGPRPEGPYVPTVGISQENGTALLAAIGNGTVVTGDLYSESLIENRTTTNVFAQTKGGDQNNVVVLGAHSDSVAPGPGINDNGSGSVGILAVARALTNWSVNNAVRFCWWSAEEFGLLGSAYYVSTLPAEELAKIRLYKNYDMIASPNYMLGIYDGDGSSFNLTGPPGSAQIEKHYEEFFRSKGSPFVATEFSGRSDYGPFLEVGVAAGGLFTGAEVLKTPEEAVLFGGQAGVAYDENYHEVGDNYANLNFKAFEINSQAIADSVAYYARDLSSIPVRNATTVAPRSVRKLTIAKSQPHSHGLVRPGLSTS